MPQHPCQPPSPSNPDFVMTAVATKNKILNARMIFPHPRVLTDIGTVMRGELSERPEHRLVVNFADLDTVVHSHICCFSLVTRRHLRPA